MVLAVNEAKHFRRSSIPQKLFIIIIIIIIKEQDDKSGIVYDNAIN